MIPNNLLPVGYRWFIAGGYAACPALASDRDVWVRVGVDAMDRVKEELLTHLNQQGFYVEALDDRRSADGFNDRHYAVTLNTRKVARVKYLNPGIHIILVDGNEDTVLSTFDVSTHQIAIRSDGEVVKGPDWTPITEPPMKLKDTPTTDARMLKISERYKGAYAQV